MQPEPVSPELVLVDPELARRERTRLEERALLDEIIERARLAPQIEVAPAPVDETMHRGPGWRDVVQFSRRRLLPAALMLSLLANGVLVGELVARPSQQTSLQTQVVLRAAAVDANTATALSTPSASVSHKTSVPEPSRYPALAKASVERRLVELILTAPARRLPRQLVDTTTGLIKNNVQVVCRRRMARSFLCVVRLPGRPANEGLYVRYRSGPNGRDAFKWYGYRFARLEPQSAK